MPESTTDTILEWMHQQAREKAPVDPLLWLEAAMKLQVLASEDTDKLIELETEVSKLRASWLDSEGVASKAEIKVKASDLYKMMRRQQAKCDRIKEMTRLAKKFAQLKSDEMRTGL